MKILVVPSWYPPYGGRFFKYQAEELAKLGHQVDVLVLHEIGFTTKVNTKINNEKSNFANEIIHSYKRIPKLNNLNIFLYIKKYKKILRKYLNNNQVDVIQVHSAIWAGVAVSEIAKKYNIPFVITEHRSLFFKKEFPFPESLKNKVKLAFDNANVIVSVSNEMKNIIKNYTTSKIEVIPNMVNTNLFISKKIKEKEHVFTFLTVGGLVRQKGIDVLIKAFIKLEKELKNKIQLKIIGEGSEEKELKKIALQTSKKIHFLGYKTIEELNVEYNKSDVFVSSSREEPFGVVIIEAMSCGLPIVATNCAGPIDIVNKDIGYLAEIEDIEDLYIKMRKMYDNYLNFNAETIRQTTINNYSYKIVINKIEKILLDIKN